MFLRLPSQSFVGRFVSTERTEGNICVDFYYDYGDTYIVVMVSDCMIDAMSVDTIAFSNNNDVWLRWNQIKKMKLGPIAHCFPCLSNAIMMRSYW